VFDMYGDSSEKFVDIKSKDEQIAVLHRLAYKLKFRAAFLEFR